MNKFYERIDYAVKNFYTLSKSKGAFTDRDKIFIKYSKPTSISRIYNPLESALKFGIIKSYQKFLNLLTKYMQFYLKE